MNSDAQSHQGFSGASPAAIQFHYDAGSEFFRLWLGKTMTYTAARFEDGVSDEVVPGGLDQAQDAKLRYHLNAVGAGPGMRLLDIGCGWGTLMQRAVDAFDVEAAAGLTLSKDQYEYVVRQGAPRVDIRLQSYEHFEPPSAFDGIVSVGAFEHFAKPSLTKERKIAAYANFFALSHKWLAPGCRLSLQTIAWGDVPEDRRSEIPVQQFFPDSELPYIEEIIEASKDYFELLVFENRRRDYELTFRSWLTNLRRNKNEATQLVGPDRYEFYDRCLQGGARLFQRRKYYLCRFVFRRLQH
jgi:cyclopropane-fatty-acyl-phospholipid synthase